MNFSLLLESALKLTYDKLSGFSDFNNNFWQVFDSAFGTQYNRSAAEILRLDWQGGNFSQLPQIEVVSNTILGNANGAYSTSTNKIYLSDTFVANANSAAVSDVILEEIGHFVDARINQTDSAGDEGAIFAALVRGESLNGTTLQSLQAENDHATIIINGEAIAIEQSALTTRDLNSVTAAQLVNTLIGNSGITPDKISNIRFIGANVAGGTFTGGLGTIGIDNGIVLSTGDIDVDDSAYSTSNGKSGDRDLDAIVKTIVANNSTNDAAVLEFDFIPSSNTISFSYVFASENYPELGNSRFNDVFAFYLNGKNIAFVPGVTTPVSINTVNTETNSAFFKPDYYGNSLGTKFDGFTTVLSAVATDLIPGVTNHIKLAIADTRDSARDSAVFIQGFSDPSTIVRVRATDSDAGEGTTANPGVFTITRTGSTNNALTVSYTISGTASTGDYSPISSTVTFLAGESSKTVTIAPVNDSLAEGTETVILSLISGTNYSLGTDNSATVIITDNDVDPRNAVVSLSVNPNPATVVEDGTTNLVYTFTRAGDLTNALTVNFNVGGSATFSSNSNYTDYTQTGAASFELTSGSITFAAGASTANLTINPKADTTFEGNENVELTLAPGSGYVINTATAVIGTITDEDTNVNVAVFPDSVLEDGTLNLVYTFSRYGKIDNDLIVNYSIGGTADGNDYTGATPGTGKTITFAAGQTTKTVTINPTEDNTFENDETVIFTIGSGTGYTVGTSGSATGTIDNDDFPRITLAVSPGSVFEDGTTNLVYTFTRTGVTTNPLTVNYSIGGTANSDDYTGATPGTGKTITFAAGANTATLLIDPTGDTTVESNETVAVTLASGTGYTLGTTAPVVGTINDDDTASITVTVTPSSVFEDGTTNLVYTFTRSYPGGTSLSLGNPLTVNFNVGGTATFNTDYTQTGAAITFPTGATTGTGTIIFLAGSPTATLTIDPTGDTTVESNETVAVTLDNGTGYTVGTTVPVTGTINDDDTASITVTVTPSSVFEDGTTNLVYTFTRSYPGGTSQSLGNPLTVDFNVGGTATFNTDYTQTGAAITFPTGATTGTGTITFAAGETTKQITINPTGDTTVESNETVAVTLASGTGYTVGTTGPVTGTINDDDTASITVTVTPSSVFEDGTTNLVYTFTRSYPGGTSLSLGNPLSVDFNVGGTATFNTDYTQTGAAITFPTGATTGTGTIRFAEGSPTATLTIDPKPDTIIENNETVAVTLANGTGYTLGTTAPVVGTINDDDTASITVTVTPGSVDEDGTTPLVYTFTRSYPGGTSLSLGNPLTVNFNVGGTATFNTDYTQTGAAITFPTGATTGTGTIRFAEDSPTATLTIEPISDDNYEDNETVAVTLASGTGYTIGTPGPVTGTINDDNDRPILSSSQFNFIGVEGLNNEAIIVINLIGANGQIVTSKDDITFNYTTSPTGAVSAISGVDYTNSTGTVTIRAGNSEGIIRIPILNDNINELDKSFLVTLSNATNATISPSLTDDGIEVVITDTLPSAQTRTLPNLVENLTLTGTGNINGTGNAGNNVITGNSGNNTLTGRAGNDTYVFSVANALGADTIVEAATGGIDTIDFSDPQSNNNGPLSINLGIITLQSVTANNNLKLTLFAGNVIENAIGGAGNDLLTGNALDNLLQGGSGNDQLSGQNGNDILMGGSGADILTGGNGNDTLWGGGNSGSNTNFLGDILEGGNGNDRFWFRRDYSISSSPLLGLSSIRDFVKGEDKIALSKASFNAISVDSGDLSATDFAVVTDDPLATFSNARIVYSISTGYVFYNSNGSAAGGESRFAKVDPGITLDRNDFTVIGTQSSSVDYVLSDLYENFNLTGTGNINGTGNTGNNFITGNIGNNILDGGSGNDTLIGGLGNDILIGGLGNDQYQFNGVFNTLGVDYIANFDGGQISQGQNRDKIALSKATFSAITNAVGQALTDFAVVGNDTLVGASNARIVYSQGTGSLFYNSNGSTLGGESKFAVLSDPTITLVSSDFTLIA